MSSDPSVATTLVRQLSRERSIWALIAPCERFASLLLLILLLPLLIVAAAIITVRSKRSPLVAHLRVGQFGAPLWTLKFRTMWPKHQTRHFTGLIEHIVDESGM